MRRAALAAYLLVLALFGLLIVRPYLDARHDTPAGVPSPAPLTATSLDVVPGGDRLCMAGVVMSEQSEQVRFRVGTYGQPGPPLGVTVKGRGYAATVPVKQGWPDNLEHRVPLPRPAHDELVTVCIRNGGRKKIALYSANDNARSRVAVSLDGKPVEPTPALAFFERAPQTIPDDAGLTADRIAVFRGVFGHAWIVWLLAALFAIGTPVLLGVALWRAADES